MYCESCGNVLESDATFCTECGALVTTQLSTAHAIEVASTTESDMTFEAIGEDFTPAPLESPTVETKNCESCGNVLESDATFCTECGDHAAFPPSSVQLAGGMADPPDPNDSIGGETFRCECGANVRRVARRGIEILRIMRQRP